MTSILVPSEQVSDVYHLIPFAHPENHPDVVVFNTEKESITIDQVRAIQKELLLRPYQETYKVFIIMNAQLLQTEAQHALLKSLEEPPHFVQFILMTQYPSMLLPTILSRCVEEKALGLGGQGLGNVVPFETLTNFSLEEKFALVKEFGKKEQAIELILDLIKQATKQLEQRPTLPIIDTIRNMQRALTSLRANTNVQLTLEWCFLKI